MKNLAKNAGLLFVALSAVFVTSCTEKDDFKVDPKGSVETTNVSFAIDAEGNETGKMIDRAAAPLYVDNLSIWANSIYPASNAFETFTFGTGTGLPTGFSLSNVALGTNTFGATSNAAEVNNRLSFGPVALPTGTSNVLDAMKAHVPYIRTYSQPNVTAVIKKTGNAPIALTMKTDYGRILARFIQDAPDADNYRVVVTANVADMNDNGEWITKSLPETVINGEAGFEWSNPYSIKGKTATFTIRIFEKSTPNAPGILLNTIVKTVEVKEATTKLCTFTIKNADVHTDIEAGGIVLTFPEISNEVIND